MKYYTYQWEDEGESDGKKRTLMLTRVAYWYENTSLKCKRLRAAVAAVDQDGKREVEGYIGEEFQSLATAQHWLDRFADRFGYRLNGFNVDPPQIIENGSAINFRD